MHARKQVRDAVATLLNASPVNWQLVTPSRIASSRQVWPYLMVFADGETSEPITVTELPDDEFGGSLCRGISLSLNAVIDGTTAGEAER